VIHPHWRIVLTITPYAVLGMLALYSVVVARGGWADLTLTLVLCLIVAGWIFVFRDLPLTARSRQHPVAVLVYLAGLNILTFVLVLRDGAFGFLTIACYMAAYVCVAWPARLVPVAATAVVAGVAQASGLGEDPDRAMWTACLILGNAVFMGGLTWGLHLARQQSERAATESERARMAREIHDTLAQGFAGIVTQLQAAEQAPDETSRGRHTDLALELAREGLNEARRSVKALRPVALDTMRLADAIHQLARTWSTRNGVPTEVIISGDSRPLPTDVEVALLRTAQEALANVERHALASRVSLTLRTDASGTRLAVKDDGRGFDPARHPLSHDDGADSSGYGLVAMRERVESVAGVFAVTSDPGHGTRVSAEVPA
jgi:signal transduction histidine kinase